RAAGPDRNCAIPARRGGPLGVLLLPPLQRNLRPRARPLRLRPRRLGPPSPSMASEIGYAKSGDVHIAYRVFGDGPRDIVLIPGTLSHVEVLWDLPLNRYLLKRLTSFARVIVF